MSFLHIDPIVSDALANGRPVVALESTVISHGLPYPQNLEIAQEMEATIVEAGATPATIAILDGQITVGLKIDQLDRLAQARDVRKCSRRDIPLAVARKQDGATTVAGTMVVASMANIRIMATGGIGGVHRGHPFDVSADLNELGRETSAPDTPVCVVCAGAKSLLDLSATLETLESLSVPVIGYQTDEFPAFYTAASGLPVSVRVDTPAQAAAIIRAQLALNYRQGTLITVPVPSHSALSIEEAETAIEQAVKQADRTGISGQALTPFLLAEIARLTNGRSIVANKALLINNCRIAAQIASKLASPLG
ncbi:MAG: pseudouridine-5'-phosphate glycosidase [Anaerolineales bacterium]|nr:pseudouridine-5'-phosphate glycosidase [Anaerolineales bacterium]